MDRKRAVPLVMGILFVLFMLGCAGYGGLSYIEPGPNEKVTISSLVDNWQDYDVYVGTLDSALMFGFKDRKKHIAPASYWDSVKTKKELDKIVANIASQPSVGIYWPRLWKILGPEGHLYGYMFTAWNHAVVSKVNKNTLFVDDMQPPPFMLMGTGTIGSGMPRE
jgi:hypothetical protein